MLAILLVPTPALAAELPSAITDEEFWRIVTQFSEPGGRFQQEFMTNEDSLQSVIPVLKRTIRRGGVYLGNKRVYIVTRSPAQTFLPACDAGILVFTLSR